MKRLLFLLTITFMFSFTAESQVADTSTYEKGRIAILNSTRDTLYIQSSMFGMIAEMWEDPKYQAEKPVLVPVQSLDAYIRRSKY